MPTKPRVSVNTKTSPPKTKRKGISPGSSPALKKLRGVAKGWDAKQKERKARLNEIIKARAAEVDEDPKWPARALFFKTWIGDDAFDQVRISLNNRGWKDLSVQVTNAAIKEMIDIVKCHKGHTLPRRCLWWVHEDDGRRLKHLPKDTMNNGRHVISTFMGTDAAVTKVNIDAMMRGCHFYPESYVLPAELNTLRKSMKKSKKSYWICKPRDDYAGQGITVYESNQPEFQKLIADKKQKKFVVQSYLHNPLLFGGYKFHFRMYTILTGVLDNYEAFLLDNGHALFSTKKYSNKLSTLGKNFDVLSHLTNWSQNFVKGNEYLKQKKDVIGVGCEWTLRQLFDGPMKKFYPKFDEEKFWKDMVEVCAVTMHRVANWKNVKALKKENDAHPRFEPFGLDVMMDTNFKIWLMEANTEVGLQPILETLPNSNCECPDKNGCNKCDGFPNPRQPENNKILEDTITASVDLMQLDVSKSQRVPDFLIPLPGPDDMSTE